MAQEGEGTVMGFFSNGGYVKEQKMERFDFPEYRIIEVTNAYGTKHWEIEKRVGEGFAWESPLWLFPHEFDSLRNARRRRASMERHDREIVGVRRRVVG